jgi:hypothetical protein
MILSIIGIVVILFLLFKFGIDALVNFSVFISGNQNQATTTNPNQINYVAIPILNPLPSATNSAQIVISGASLKDYSIVLYINNSEVDQSNTDQNGKFHFTEDLNKGSNQIAVRAKYNNKQSELSDVQSVNYTNSQPKLDVNSPSDGQHFDKNTIGTGNTITVSGATDPGVSVTVNGLWAVIDDNNNFSYILTLQNGDTQIKIVATDQAGNKSEKDLKVSYSQ